MKSFATISLGLFIGITIIYFLLKAHFMNKAKDIKIITVLYFIITLLSQLGIVISATKTMCGNVQWLTAVIYGLLPWIIIFGGLVGMLKIFPGWKSPFSNTFGYLVVYLMGIRKVFNELVRSNINTDNVKFNKAIQEVYEDQSLLINQFTPDNWVQALTKLAPILNKNVFKKSSKSSSSPAGQQKGGAESTQNTGSLNMTNPFVKQLEYLVQVKDEVASLIWYVFTGSLITSMSSMGVLSSQCDRSMKQIQESHNKYQATTAAKAKETATAPKPMVYKVRD